MSNKPNKYGGVSELPIFPLPLTLVPAEILPLHIFEDKYREMLADISRDKRIFGINFFDPTKVFAEKPEIGSVGCAAELLDTKDAGEGRSNIIVSGAVRYRILQYVESDVQYLVAKVEFFEDIESNPELTLQKTADLHEIFNRIAEAAFHLSGAAGLPPTVRLTLPEEFSFTVCSAFNLPPEEKYELLQLQSTLARMAILEPILNEAIERIEGDSNLAKSAKTNGHSKKPIDL